MIITLSLSLSFFTGMTAMWFYREHLEKKTATAVAELAYESAHAALRKELQQQADKKQADRKLDAVLYGGPHDGAQVVVPLDIERIDYNGTNYAFASRTEKETGRWIFSCV